MKERIKTIKNLKDSEKKFLKIKLKHFVYIIIFSTSMNHSYVLNHIKTKFNSINLLGLGLIVENLYIDYLKNE